MEFESLEKEKEIENVALVSRGILNDDRYKQLPEYDILLVFLTSSKIKPVSIIHTSPEDEKTFIEVVEKLGLNYHLFPPYQPFSSEMVIGKNLADINEMKSIIEQADKDKQFKVDKKYNERMGQLLGYPPTAISAFINQTSQFEDELAIGKAVPDELTIAVNVGGAIPASLDDISSIEYGRKIMNFLNKIDPKIIKSQLQRKTEGKILKNRNMENKIISTEIF